MIQLPDVIERCVSDVIVGVVGSGKAKSVKGAAKSALLYASSESGAGASVGGLGRLEDGGLRRRGRSLLGGKLNRA